MHAFFFENAFPIVGNKQHIGLINVEVCQKGIERSKIDFANRPLLQIEEENAREIRKNLLMKPIGRGRHVEIAFDELIIRRPIGQFPVIVRRQRGTLEHARTLRVGPWSVNATNSPSRLHNCQAPCRTLKLPAHDSFNFGRRHPLLRA